MPIFNKSDFIKSPLPVTNGRLVDIVKAKKVDILLACVYADGFLVKSEYISVISVLTEDKLRISGDAWYLVNEFISGAFYLTGEVLFRGDDALVGIFSWKLNKPGWIWAGDLQKRCTPL